MASASPPLGLIARTLNVCAPTASGPAYSFGEPQGAYAPLSRLHSNLAPAASAVNSNVADVCTVVRSGPDVMLTSGGAAASGGLTHHAYSAGVRSTFLAASTARTAKVWLPIGS